MSDLIKTLASYVPALISRRLAVDPTPISTPAADTFPAAVLFVDISGFTALTERLARQGPAGAEELSQLLNTYFSKLINLIDAYEGDIVKFAGDGLIALWPAADESGQLCPDCLADAMQQATRCSLAAREHLNDYEVTPDVRLSIKMMLGAGDLITVHLGGEYGRWEFFVTGAPIVQVGLAASYAQAGDVLLSPEAWALVRDIAAGVPVSPQQKSAPDKQGATMRLTELRLATPALPIDTKTNKTPADLPVEAEAGLRAYIPGAILARLAAIQTDWLAELRRVTILFINLPNLNYDISLQQAQTLMCTLQQELYRYEGSINKLGVDDKGVTLVAAFGLPPLAHPDDAERGVRAAQTIQARLRQLGVKGAIGVTTGRVFCGSIGNDLRREYTMNGDVVNLAARLMQATSDDILCEEATYQAAQLNLAFEPLDPIKVKGKADPVAIYRPLGEKEGIIRRETIIIGREAERDQLEKHLQTLLRGNGGVVLIEGDTGMGKSRLVDDLLHQADALGIASLVGGGDSIDKSTPYHAWRPIFKDVFKLETGPAEPAAQRAFILAQLQTELAPAQEFVDSPEIQSTSTGAEIDPWLHLTPLLKAVLPLDWPENELTAQMSGKVRADNTHDLLIYILQQVVHRGQAVGRPYTLVFDDAHWLDSASWALTQLVAQQVQPLLLVIVTRPMTDPIPGEYSQLRRDSQTELISLERLSQNDTAAFVSECLGVNSLPELLADFIYSKADGNPLFSEELTYALRDAGFINVSNGQCRLSSSAASLQDLHLPDTVQGVITSRIDRLTPSQQLTLKVASVIGRIFEYDTLRDIHPIEADRARLAEYLDTLDRLDITQLEEPEPDLAYIFKQMTTQEVAYNMMLFSQRRELHQAVARWYESAYAEDLSPFYSMLAYHWQAAADTIKAINYLEKAGNQALHNYANEEAVEFFSQALALADELKDPVAIPPPQRRGQWEIKLGEAYVNWAKLSEGQVHFEHGLACLGFPVPTGAARLGISLAGQVLRQMLCQVWSSCGVGRRAANREHLLAAARAYEGLTAIYYFANKTMLTLYSAYRSLNLAEAAGPSPELARGYASVGVINSFIPLHRMAESYCRRALDMARQINNLPALAWVSLLSGVYYAGVGRWRAALKWLGQVVDLAERLGDHSRWDDGVGNLAMVNYFCGEFNQSAKLYDDLLSSAAQRQDAHNQAWALRGQVYCLLLQGEFHEALARLETIQDILTQNTHIVDEALNIDLHGLLAVVYLRRGQTEEALAQAEQALKLIAQTSPTSFLSLPGYAGVAETLLALWELNPGDNNSHLKEAARRACQALHSYTRVFPIGRPQALLWQGLFEWLSGRPAHARRLWTKSQQTAGQLEMPYAAGLAHYELGRHLPVDDSDRAEHLSQARAIFTRLAAGFDLQRIQEEQSV